MTTNNRSYPVRILLDEETRSLLSAAGVALAGNDASVRLEGNHFDAIDSIVRLDSRPGDKLNRQRAIMIALHAFCKQLTQGRRYESFTDLVRDALLWYTGRSESGQSPFSFSREAR